VTEDILSNYQHVIEDFRLIMGSKGAFEFKVDDQLLFSKKEMGRHAEPGEVLQEFKKLVGGGVSTYPQSK
jgi:selenoprotein W-related protein